MTKKQKLESFDAVQAERDKLSLALWDLANDRFSSALRMRASNFMKGESGYYIVRLSNRHMPLVLVHDHTGGSPCTPSVWTEREIEDMYRTNPTSLWPRVLRTALDRLKDAARESAA